MSEDKTTYSERSKISDLIAREAYNHAASLYREELQKHVEEFRKMLREQIVAWVVGKEI